MLNHGAVRTPQLVPIKPDRLRQCSPKLCTATLREALHLIRVVRLSSMLPQASPAKLRPATFPQPCRKLSQERFIISTATFPQPCRKLSQKRFIIITATFPQPCRKLSQDSLINLIKKCIFHF